MSKGAGRVGIRAARSVEAVDNEVAPLQYSQVDVTGCEGKIVMNYISDKRGGISWLKM